MSITRRNIVVIGSANMDLVARVPRGPRPGESMIGRGFAVVPGGKGANQAVAAALLGAEVVFGGCVGKDAFGAMQREGLARAGVDTAFLRVDGELPTGTAIILVDDAGQNSIVVTPSANLAFLPEHVEAMEEAIARADAVLLQLEIPLESVERALEIANRHGVLSVLDAGPAQKVDAALLKKAAILSPNETEAEAILGHSFRDTEEAEHIAELLHGLGAREVVLKLGADGALYSGQSRCRMPAFAVEAVDTTAAGDVFTAALAVCWGEGVEAAMRFAAGAAALSVTRAGAQTSIPRREEVDAFLRTRG